MVGVHTYVPTRRDPLYAAVIAGLNLPTTDWAVMVRKGVRVGGIRRQNIYNIFIQVFRMQGGISYGELIF